MNGEEPKEPVGTSVTAFMMVCWIHHTKTASQRGAMIYLLLLDWIQRGELAAADHFFQVYCLPPYNNWNYTCTGEQMVYPSNCPIESNNHHNIKGGTNPVRANVSPETYLVETCPTLIRNEVHHGRDPCTIEYPNNCSRLMVVITACYQEDVDICQCFERGGKSYWLANLNGSIGCPITDDRIKEMEEAETGNIHHFLSSQSSPRMYCTAASKMIKATGSICKLKWKDGTILGDCISCWKKGGYGCPGASFLRSHFNLFPTPLKRKRKVRANGRGEVHQSSLRGQKDEMYHKGRAIKEKKRRVVPEMIQSDDEYIKTVGEPTIRKCLEYLRISHCVPVGSDGENTLLDFWSDPCAFRKRQNNKKESCSDPNDNVDDLSVASFNVMEEIDDSFIESLGDVDNFALDSLFDEYNE